MGSGGGGRYLLPATSGPWPVPRPGGGEEAVTWTLADRRTYSTRSPSGTMEIALYEPDHRPPPGEPDARLCLVVSADSGRVAEGAHRLLRAGAIRLVTARLAWPLWRGLWPLTGAERPRGVAAHLRVLAPDLFATADLYVPALWGKGGKPS